MMSSAVKLFALLLYISMLKYIVITTSIFILEHHVCFDEDCIPQLMSVSRIIVL